jgi:hypothetical protein
MPLPVNHYPRLPQIIQEIGRHEAGHYIIGRCLGFKMNQITIQLLDPTGAHSGEASVTLPQPIATLDTLLKYAEFRVLMLYAGSLAQALSPSGINNETALDIVKNKGGKNDYDKARELVHIVRNIKYPNDATEAEAQAHLSQIDNELWCRATEIVGTEAEIIKGLGRRIASEVAEIGTKYTITANTIDNLPAIASRFAGSP